MTSNEKHLDVRLDAVGLFLAGLINTFLALLVAGVVLGAGTIARQPDLLLRTNWITENVLLWKAGWFFWFAVTLSFAWSYFAIGRHLDRRQPWVSLGVGLAVIAAAVDLVGVMINITILPDLASELVTAQADGAPALQVFFRSAESLAHALINVAAFGLYSFAGLLLLPAVFSTSDYPRWLAWLGAAEWIIAALATILLVVDSDLSTGPLLVSFALYAPWVWASAVWLLRSMSEAR